MILKLGLHGDRKSTVYERSALAELLAGVAPRLSDYHGLPNLRTPISSSIILPLFLPLELRWDCVGIQDCVSFGLIVI